MANLTRDAVLEVITGQGRGQRAVIVDAPEHARLVLDGNDLVLHAGGRKGDHPVSEDGAKALLKFTGAGPRLFEVIEPKLGQRVLTDYLRHTPFGLVIEGDKMVDIKPASEFHFTVAPERLVDIALEAANEGAGFDRVVQVAPSKIELHLVAARELIVFNPHGHERINDLVAAGAAITFSPTGIVAPMIRGYTQRRVCTNGLVVTENVMEFEYNGDNGNNGGDGRRFWPWLRRGVHSAIEAIGPTIEQFQRLADQAVEPDQRAEVMEGFMQAARLNNGERDLVMAQAMDYPPENLWEALNTVTWLGTHAAANPQRGLTLMARAGNIAQQEIHERLCPMCHRTHAALN